MEAGEEGMRTRLTLDLQREIGMAELISALRLPYEPVLESVMSFRMGRTMLEIAPEDWNYILDAALEKYLTEEQHK